METIPHTGFVFTTATDANSLHTEVDDEISDTERIRNVGARSDGLPVHFVGGR